MRLIDADAINLSDRDDLAYSENDIKDFISNQPTINPFKEVLEKLEEDDFKYCKQERPLTDNQIGYSIGLNHAIRLIKEVMKKYEQKN